MNSKPIALTLSNILFLIFLFAIGFTAFATNSRQIGDVNSDGRITIQDATITQKHLASLVFLSDKDLLYADLTQDTKVTIKDATAIQKYLVGLFSLPTNAYTDTTPASESVSSAINTECEPTEIPDATLVTNNIDPTEFVTVPDTTPATEPTDSTIIPSLTDSTEIPTIPEHTTEGIIITVTNPNTTDSEYTGGQIELPDHEWD